MESVRLHNLIVGYENQLKALAGIERNYRTRYLTRANMIPVIILAVVWFVAWLITGNATISGFIAAGAAGLSFGFLLPQDHFCNRKLTPADAELLAFFFPKDDVTFLKVMRDADFLRVKHVQLLAKEIRKDIVKLRDLHQKAIQHEALAKFKK